MEDGQNSPYSGAERDGDRSDLHRASSDVPEFAAAGGEDGARRRTIGRALDDGAPRAARRLRGPSARSSAARCAAAFDAFRARRVAHRHRPRAARFAAFIERAALVARRLRALPRAARRARRPSTGASGSPGSAIASPARSTTRAPAPRAGRSAITPYLQWIADEQWQRARARRRRRRRVRRLSVHGQRRTAPTSGRVSTSSDSTRRSACRPTRSPRPGRTGGCPPIAGTSIAAGGYEWLRQRARRCAELYDGFRVDHLVGFYRTYVRERDGRTALRAARRAGAARAGRARCSASSASAARGSSPRTSASSPTSSASRSPRLRRPRHEGAALGAGLGRAGQPFRDPLDYPAASVAIDRHARHRDAGRVVGQRAARRARAAAWRCRRCAPRARRRSTPFDDRDPRRAARRRCSAPAPTSSSSPIQDLFGWRDRINTPALVDDQQLDVAAALAGRGPDRPSPRGAAERAAFLPRVYGETGPGDADVVPWGSPPSSVSELQPRNRAQCTGGLRYELPPRLRPA